MKRFTLFLLCLCLLPIWGCSSHDAPKGVAFYYCASLPAYTVDSSAITPEYRAEISDGTLLELLDLYLKGPISADLTSPFPEGLQIVSAIVKGDTVQVVVSLEMAALTGLDLTIACSCLTLTCLAYTEAEQVEIRPVYGLLDGQRMIIMNKDTILLTGQSKMAQ